MKYTNVTALKWANKEHTLINMLVDFEHLPAEVPFTASPTDVEQHGVELFNRAVIGEWGEISEYVPPVTTSPKQPTTTGTLDF